MARPRKIAPVEMVDYSRTDERGELVRMYAPECIERKERSVKRDHMGRVTSRTNVAINEWHSYFGDPSVPDSFYLRRGYEAVKDEKGTHVTHKGDKLWKIKTAVVQKDFDRAAQESKELLDAAQEVNVPDEAEEPASV